MPFFSDILSETQRVVPPLAQASEPAASEIEMDFDAAPPPEPAMEHGDAAPAVPPRIAPSPVHSAPAPLRFAIDPVAAIPPPTVVERHIDNSQREEAPPPPLAVAPRPASAEPVAAPAPRTTIELRDVHNLQTAPETHHVLKAQAVLEPRDVLKAQAVPEPQDVLKAQAVLAQREAPPLVRPTIPLAVSETAPLALSPAPTERPNSQAPPPKAHAAAPLAAPAVREDARVPVAGFRAPASAEPHTAAMRSSPPVANTAAASARLPEGPRVHIGRVEVVIVQPTPPPAASSNLSPSSSSSLLSRRYLRSL